MSNFENHITPSSNTESDSKKNKPAKKLVALGAAAAIATGAACTPENADADKTVENHLDDTRESHLVVDQNPNSHESIVAEGKRRAAKKQEAAEKRDAQSDIRWERARDLAKKMEVYEAVIENGDIVEKLSLKKVGGVIVEINGKQVPQKEYTPEELKSLESARKQYAQQMNTMNAPQYETNQDNFNLDDLANDYDTNPEEYQSPQKSSKKDGKSNGSKNIESIKVDGSIY